MLWIAKPGLPGKKKRGSIEVDAGSAVNSGESVETGLQRGLGTSGPRLGEELTLSSISALSPGPLLRGITQFTPPGDEIAALAIDVHGAYGSGWLDLLQRLARQAMERRPGLPGLPGFNAAGSLAQVFRMRLSVSLQRSLAHAVHSRAGRALVAASGSRLPASLPASSYSDLMLLTRGYLASCAFIRVTRSRKSGTLPRPGSSRHSTASARRDRQPHPKDLREGAGSIEAWRTLPPLDGLPGKPLKEIYLRGSPTRCRRQGQRGKFTLLAKYFTGHAGHIYRRIRHEVLTMRIPVAETATDAEKLAEIFRRFAKQFPENTVSYKEELFRLNLEAEEIIIACYAVLLIEQSETTISQQDLAAQFLRVVAGEALEHVENLLMMRRQQLDKLHYDLEDVHQAQDFTMSSVNERFSGAQRSLARGITETPITVTSEQKLSGMRTVNVAMPDASQKLDIQVITRLVLLLFVIFAVRLDTVGGMVLHCTRAWGPLELFVEGWVILTSNHGAGTSHNYKYSHLAAVVAAVLESNTASRDPVKWGDDAKSQVVVQTTKSKAAESASFTVDCKLSAEQLLDRIYTAPLLNFNDLGWTKETLSNLFQSSTDVEQSPNAQVAAVPILATTKQVADQSCDGSAPCRSPEERKRRFSSVTILDNSFGILKIESIWPPLVLINSEKMIAALKLQSCDIVPSNMRIKTATGGTDIIGIPKNPLHITPYSDKPDKRTSLSVPCIITSDTYDTLLGTEFLVPLAFGLDYNTGTAWYRPDWHICGTAKNNWMIRIAAAHWGSRTHSVKRKLQVNSGTMILWFLKLVTKLGIPSALHTWLALSFSYGRPSITISASLHFVWLALDMVNVGRCSKDEISLAAHMLRCVAGSECNASHNLLRDAVYGLVHEAGYLAAMKVPSIMPVVQKRGRPYVRHLDVVATHRRGVATTSRWASSSPRRRTHRRIPTRAPTPTVP
eukprot:SM000384S14658  [mRNA]  locus=s384:41288:51760:+ [translate_table: standard]